MENSVVPLTLSNHDRTVVYFLRVRRGGRYCALDSTRDATTAGCAKPTRTRRLRINRHHRRRTPELSPTEPRTP